jgi:hypothetical protein
MPSSGAILRDHNNRSGLPEFGGGSTGDRADHSPHVSADSLGGFHDVACLQMDAVYRTVRPAVHAATVA